MNVSCSRLFVVLVSLLGACEALQLGYQVQLRSATFPGLTVRQGNGVTISPDDSVVTTTFEQGIVIAYSNEGDEPMFLWEYVPSVLVGGHLHPYPLCQGLVAWADTSEFFVYAIAYPNDDSYRGERTQILVVDRNGQEMYASQPILGRISGSPVIGKERKFMYFTLNYSTSRGMFYVLDIGRQEVFNVAGDAGSGSFGPVAIYHQPEGGFYPGGESNTQDLVCWLSGSSGAGDGLYCFQHMQDSEGRYGGNPYKMITPVGLGEERYVSTMAPVIGNAGYSIWWGAQGARLVGINGGSEHDSSQSFDHGIAAEIQVEQVCPPEDHNSRNCQQRNPPPGQLPFWAAPVASTTDPDNSVLFGGGVTNLFYRAVSRVDKSANGNNTFSVTTIPTKSLVKTQAKICYDALIYYIESYGVLHQASFDNASDVDTYTYSDQTKKELILGEFAVSSDCSRIYFALVNGMLVQVQALGFPGKISSPAPSMAPTEGHDDMPPSKDNDSIHPASLCPDFGVKSSSGGGSWAIIVVTALVVSLMWIMVGGCLYYKWSVGMNRRAQLCGILAQYMPIDGQKDGSTVCAEDNDDVEDFTE